MVIYYISKLIWYPDEKDGGNAPQVSVAFAAEDEDDMEFHDASDDRKALLSRLCDYGAEKVEDATKALGATNGATLEKNGQILRVAYAKSILGPGSGPSRSSRSKRSCTPN
ncbi:SUPPRESSOR OF ABI3-5 [Camellia lanceoleosa]|uniref:SUPPRESSOR OF ABI3-5 n=1 Tax=Camellia lanceoleosa TaxID=1840588 RepID=A0ACC0FVJ5_9ERIC|nr:SUPPRESSOR OF ABI3-5 [Camellia lanceoleosa]